MLSPTVRTGKKITMHLLLQTSQTETKKKTNTANFSGVLSTAVGLVTVKHAQAAKAAGVQLSTVNVHHLMISK